ncbi:hypothetical protein TSUD_393400 [Trifolium subterraneum]|uniref:CCHC-type domain-containing protein n=1 Tax=Trifolium subterraneum TaxID=3900 RepID=A0A2Z6NAK7_TRISU|nr:hypothetical protein TSUD_393400 [Trifolium subterraneum]
MNTNGFGTNILVLDGKNWDRWSAVMKTLFESKKKDCKALFYIQQNVDAHHFEKISKATTSKEAWDVLESYHDGGEKVKHVKLQAFRKRYETMQMEEDQKVSDYFSKLLEIVHQMQTCGENVIDQMVVEKALRYLSPRFDYIVVAIQEAKDITTMKTEQLQSSLETHELTILNRNSERLNQQALQAQTFKKEGNGKNYNKKGKGNSNWKNNGKSKTDEKPESSKRGGFNKGQNKKNGFDKSKVKCYNCEKMGHFADECWFKNNGEGNGSEENVVEGKDPNSVLMMATTCDESGKSDEWYLDSGCSNHMTSQWLTGFDSSKKTSIKPANSRKLAAEGTGNIVIRSKNGVKVIIGDVLYVPDMNCNLMSIDVEALWHKRYGHLNFRSLRELNSKELVHGLPKINVSNKICEVCVKSKHSRTPFVSEMPKRASVALGVIHSDIGGPFETPSLGGIEPMYSSEIQQGFIYSNSSDESDNDDSLNEVETVPEVGEPSNRPQRTRQVPNRLNDCEITSDNAVNDEGDIIHFALLADSEPIDYKDALKNSVWKRAMEEELQSIEKNKTWKLVNLPDKKKKIDVKWVFKMKLNPDGTISKHKARLVARGFLQKHGVDYNEVFAPVARIETVRLVVALACKNRWLLCHLDVKSAFLNGPREEEVYVSQAPGFEIHGKENMVYKLHKALYGLKQSSKSLEQED